MTKPEELKAAMDAALATYDAAARAAEAAYADADAYDAELIMQSIVDLGQAQDAYEAQLVVEKKLADLNDNIKDLFNLLDATEETDDGRLHRPVQIVCARTEMLIKLENVLATLKSTLNETIQTPTL